MEIDFVLPQARIKPVLSLFISLVIFVVLQGAVLSGVDPGFKHWGGERENEHLRDKIA
jgi:hypothetical protein